MQRKRNGPFITGESASLTSFTIGISLVISLLLSCGSATAQVQGQAVACHCYCNINVPAPCGDEDCKRACGWKAPSTGGGVGAAGGLYQPFYGLGNAIGQSIGKALFGDPAQKAREQAEAAQRAAEEARLAEIARQRAEAEEAARRAEAARKLQESYDRLSSQLQLSDGFGVQKDSLPLMLGDGDDGLRPRGTQFFGQGGGGGPVDATPPKGNSATAAAPPDPGNGLPLLLGDPNDVPSAKPATANPGVVQKKEQDQQKPKGTGTMDCAKTKAVRDRLATGLPVQLETIKRTEEQLKEARKGVREAGAERNAVLIKGALEEVKAYTHGLLKTTDALRGQIEALRGLDPAKRDLLIRTLHTIAFSAEDLKNTGKAGKKAAMEAQKKVQNLASVIDEFNRFMADSGITDEASQEFLGELAGPWGEFGFRAGKLAIDLSAAVYAGNISKEEQEAAQKNLSIMEKQYQRVKQHISELDRDLGESCNGRPQVQ